MSEAPTSEKLQELLAATYADITMHAREEMLPTAEKAFYSTRDFALGDTVSCTAEAALENCEQIKSCFPREAPASVLANVDKVKEAIRHLAEGNRPSFLRKLLIPALLIAFVGMAVYHLMHLR
jgi:hypothetical protein